MNDPRLSELYAEALARRADGGRTACPSPEQIFALAERTLPEAERLRLFDHVMACEDCRREYALADAAVRPGRPSRKTLIWAIAATLALVAGVSLVRRTSFDAGRLRGGGNEVILLSPAEAEVLSVPATFAWRPTSAGAEYSFELLGPSGDPVFQVLTSDTIAVLPDTVRLTTGATYRWGIRSRLPDGSESVSSLRSVRAAPR
ncbi:MAG TPA: zf-HC2 domain-containing protein [Gemmatimonadales bacterium]|nr:zf-HC2 domain-containing protein [Gemmatimonadales bacterium]